MTIVFLPLKRAECKFREVISVVKCLFLTYQVKGQYKRGMFAILCELLAQLLTSSCCHSAGRMMHSCIWYVCLALVFWDSPLLGPWRVGIIENCLFRPGWSHPPSLSSSKRILCNKLFHFVLWGWAAIAHLMGKTVYTVLSFYNTGPSSLEISVSGSSLWWGRGYVSLFSPAYFLKLVFKHWKHNQRVKFKRKKYILTLLSLQWLHVLYLIPNS